MDWSWWQPEIARPWCLAGLAAVPLIVWLTRRSLVNFRPWQRTASAACRVLVATAIVLAAAGFHFERSTGRLFVVFAVDRSASIDPDAANRWGKYLSDAMERQGDSRVGFLYFAGRMTPVRADRRDETADVDAQASNLAAAIRAARAAIPADRVGRIVLLSDGRQTQGDAVAAAEAARVPVSVVPLAAADPEVYLSAIEAEPSAREGEPFPLDVVIHSDHEEKECTLELSERSGGVCEIEQVALRKGENRFRFRLTMQDRDTAVLTASVRPSDAGKSLGDTLAGNNEASTAVSFLRRPQVLVIASEPIVGERLEQMLHRENIGVEAAGDAAARRDALAGLDRFDLLVLANVPAAAFSRPEQEAIGRWVRGGGGIIVIGGDRAFALGGYQETTLEDVLPVWCRFKEKKEEPSLALVLVIDRSESMRGQKIALAKEATRRAVELLRPEDQVGVIAFNDAGSWISPIQPCSDKAAVLAEVDNIDAAGGTNLYPAMERAYLALLEADTERKHVIVLTDGDSIPDDFNRLAETMAGEGITVSTIEMARPGRKADESGLVVLQDIAERGKGRHYYCDDPEAVPQVFVRDTLSASKRGINEKPFRPRVADAAAMLPGFEVGKLPQLLGYVETIPKKGSRTVLESEDGDPLLVWWRYGQGMAVAYTSDVTDRWASLWLKDRGENFNRFWVQLVRHAMREARPGDYVMHIDHRDGRAIVTLDGLNESGGFLNGADVELHITDPDKVSKPVDVPQVAPGRYRATVPAESPGIYSLDLSVDYQGEKVHEQHQMLVVNFPDELRVRRADETLLRSVAEASGGMFDPTPEELFAAPEMSVSETVSLGKSFLLAAILLFVVDVALRRVDLARWTSP